MVVAILAFAASLGLALALTPAVARLARRVGALDHPLADRKVHATPVPRIGGLAIAAAFAGGVAASAAAGGPSLLGSRMAGLLVAAGLALATGVADDLRGLSPKVKLALQAGAAAAAWIAGLRLDEVAVPLAGTWSTGALSFPLTVLFLVGAMNAMNLVDGLDGLAGGIAATVACSAVAVALVRGDAVLAVLGASVAGASLGFVRHNLRPGTIFMGDGGSLLLGLVLAAAWIPGPDAPPGGVDLVVPMVALGVPVLDTGLAVLRRAARGAPIMTGDRDHLHHRLLAAGFSPRGASLVLVGLSAVHGAVAVGVAGSTGLRPALLLAGLVLVDAAFLRAAGYGRAGFLARLAEERRRHVGLRRVVRAAGQRLRAARSLDDVQAALDAAAAGLGAERARLLLSRDARPGLRGSRMRLGLRGDRPGGGSIELRWAPARSRPDLPARVAAEMLGARVAGAVRRLREDARTRS